MEPNIPLIRKVMEHIESEPDSWHQDTWFSSVGFVAAPDLKAALAKDGVVETADVSLCGTTACFAGHTLLLTGQAALRLESREAGYVETTMIDTTTGKEVEDIPLAARKALGLTVWQASEIFYFYANTPKRLREQVEDVIGERL